MQFRLNRLWVAGVLLAAVLIPASRAQGQVRPVFVRPPGVTNIRVQTSVNVPNGGSVLVGGYSRVWESRREYGVGILGRTPYIGRGYRNIGYGRSTTYGSVRASGRIINLRDEEFRQTGFRSP